jgi:hypothetical protein
VYWRKAVMGYSIVTATEVYVEDRWGCRPVCPATMVRIAPDCGNCETYGRRMIHAPD